MPIDFDFSKTELYQEGAEAMRLKMEAEKRDSIISILKDGAVSLQQIANWMNVSLKYVKQINREMKNSQSS